MGRPYYELKIYVDPLRVDSEIVVKYMENICEQKQLINDYKQGKQSYIDAGIDLFVPKSQTILSGAHGQKVNMCIKCAMNFVDPTSINAFSSTSIPVGYYLYPRSSTGSKTTLRLSNSVGIIDAGYRGDIMALFDNVGTDDVIINKNDRIVQLCSPNLTYPILPILVETEQELGSTSRGMGGLGSTGR